MAIENSTNWVVEHDTIKVNNLTDVSMTISGETIDVTNKGSNAWARKLMGTKSAAGSYGAHFEKTATQGFEEAYDDLVAGTTATLLHHAGEASGDVTYSIPVLITSVELAGGVEEALSYTVNWESNGEPTKTTVI